MLVCIKMLSVLDLYSWLIMCLVAVWAWSTTSLSVDRSYEVCLGYSRGQLAVLPRPPSSVKKLKSLLWLYGICAATIGVGFIPNNTDGQTSSGTEKVEQEERRWERINLSWKLGGIQVKKQPLDEREEMEENVYASLAFDHGCWIAELNAKPQRLKENSPGRIVKMTL